MPDTDSLTPNSVQDASFAQPPGASAQTGSDLMPSSTWRARGIAWVREHWPIACLLVVFLAIQLYVLPLTNEQIFDEKWWVPEAQRIVERAPLERVGYTSLGKLIIASGISIFGDNPWGWRVFSVLLGAASVVLLYLIARTLAGRRTALLASLLLVTNALFFSLSGLATLDISFVFFMLLSFLLYLRHRYALSGLSLALSVLCKPAGILAVFAILGHWWLTRRKEGFRTVGLFSASALLAFFILLPVTDFIATGQWFNPLARLSNMFLLHSLPIYPPNAEGTSNPWEWLILPTGILTKSRYTLMVTPTIWLLTIPSLAYLFYRYFFVMKNRNTARFVLLWFAATYLLWIPITLISARPMYIHYFLPTVGATCIAIGYALHRVWQRSERSPTPRARWALRSLVVIFFVFNVLAFLFLSPLNSGLIDIEV